MTPQLTPEQLRRIDALVAECMGWRVFDPLPESGRLYGGHPRTGSHLEIPLYCGDYAAWGQVEKWMVENFTRENKFDYWIAMRTYVEHPISEAITNFASMTAPLPLRCLAFLSAMGKDVEEILKEKADEPAT